MTQHMVNKAVINIDNALREPNNNMQTYVKSVFLDNSMDNDADQQVKKCCEHILHAIGITHHHVHDAL